MSTTISTQVRDGLNYGFPEPYTNWLLSLFLDIPEPSVRRATRELLKRGIIRSTGLTSRGARIYVGLPATEAQIDG